MKTLFLLLIVLYTSREAAFAQDKAKLDSLKQVLAKLPPEGRSFASDTLRVKVLCEMGEQFEIPDSIINYVNKAISISSKRNWIEGNYITNYRYAKSLKNKGLFLKALDVFFGLLLLTEKNLMRKREAIILRDIADTHLWLSDYKLAINYYYKSMAIFKVLKEFEEYADTQNNLAITFYNIHLYDKAISLLKDCLNYLPYIKGKMSEISFYDNLSMSYGGKKMYNTALAYSLKSLKTYKKFGLKDDQFKSRSIIIMGFNYLRNGDIEKALNCAHLTKNLNEKYGGNQIDLNQLYYEIYKNQGNLRNAIYYLEKYRKAEKEKAQFELSRQIEALKSIYQLDKEKENVRGISLKYEKKAFQNKIIVIVLGLILIFLVFAYWSFINQKRKNILIQEQKDAIQQLNDSLEIKVFERTSELQKAYNEIKEAMLKGQTLERRRVASELHDNLGSMLSGVRYRLQALSSDNLTEKEKIIYNGIMEMMGDAYSEVRLISHNLLPAELESKGLVGALEKLTNDINLGEKLIISLYIEEINFVLEKKAELEIYSICLELVNNILKHAEATKASIRFYKKSNAIYLEISDNGKGIPPEIQNAGTGIKNIKNRLTSLGGQIGIQSIERQGTIVLIEIPLLVLE